MTSNLYVHIHRAPEASMLNCLSGQLEQNIILSFSDTLDNDHLVSVLVSGRPQAADLARFPNLAALIIP